MKRIIAFLLFFSLSSLLWAGGVTVTTAAPKVVAQAAILIDRQTGVVLWQNSQAEKSLPMASTTKIVTAMVILDHGMEKLDQLVTVSSKASSVGGSSVLGNHDTVTLHDVLVAALVRSSNEATVAAAEFLAGDEATFVKWMNAKANAILGSDNHTHFANPHGLYAAEHYSSAHDLALLARYALNNYPLIVQIIACGYPRGEKITVVNSGRICYLGNRNKLLGKPVPGITGAYFDGVKTGYVNKSGGCFISSATRNDWQLISVVLNSKNIFGDSKSLMKYGFSQYRWKSFATASQPALETKMKYGTQRTLPLGVATTFGVPVSVTSPEDYRVVFQGETPRAPIVKGQKVGTLIIKLNGKTVISDNAIALVSVPVVWWVSVLSAIGLTLLTLLAIVVTGKIYGTIAKNSRRRRYLLTTQRREVNSRRTSDS